jgi:hypothetical protein
MNVKDFIITIHTITPVGKQYKDSAYVHVVSDLSLTVINTFVFWISTTRHLSFERPCLRHFAQLFSYPCAAMSLLYGNQSEIMIVIVKWIKSYGRFLASFLH